MQISHLNVEYIAIDTSKYKEGTQGERLLRLLKDYKKVTLPMILQIKPRIADYKTVIYILRKRGNIIDCQCELVRNSKGNSLVEKRSVYEYLGWESPKKLTNTPKNAKE